MASKSHLPHHACPLVPALLSRPVLGPVSCPHTLPTSASSGFISVSHLPINQRSLFLSGKRLLSSPGILAEPAGTLFQFSLHDQRGDVYFLWAKEVETTLTSAPLHVCQRRDTGRLNAACLQLTFAKHREVATALYHHPRNGRRPRPV